MSVFTAVRNDRVSRYWSDLSKVFEFWDITNDTENEEIDLAKDPWVMAIADKAGHLRRIVSKGRLVRPEEATVWDRFNGRMLNKQYAFYREKAQYMWVKEMRMLLICGPLFTIVGRKEKILLPLIKRSIETNKTDKRNIG